ncbi:MAG: hypothetical protein M3495_09290 [Pseudomonadota bacterium]|nr:hypothetical protein [Pseudomonadota bacterium]
MNSMTNKLRRGTPLIILLIACLIGPVRWVSSQASLKPDQLDELIMEAKSKTDHERLAGYFEQEAQALQAKAERHQKLAENYEKGGSYEKVKGFMLQHCNAMIRSYRGAAEENLALARMHRQLAAEAR